MWSVERQNFEGGDGDRARLGGYSATEPCYSPRPDMVLSTHWRTGENGGEGVRWNKKRIMLWFSEKEVL